MFFEKIVSEGLAHYSYIIGDSNEAVVIDPRRDCSIYVEKAVSNDMKICHVLETHRNEDYVIGSKEISEQTGCEIWHADKELDYKYGKPITEGQKWKVGKLEIMTISTPGHTPGSFSFLLYDANKNPWMIFSGDALFAGDVGRCDLINTKRTKEFAEKLYHSIFDKILSFGNEIILCPAHGAGSSCGTEISDRSWTTLGLERKYNPKLQIKKKEDFIQKVAIIGEKPPYFTRMEKLNLTGAAFIKNKKNPAPLSAEEFRSKAQNGLIVDTRSELAFAAAHIENSLFIWKDGIPKFAGWFIPYGKPLFVVCDDNTIYEIETKLARMGYDNLVGYLAGGILSWQMKGFKTASIQTLIVHEICCILDNYPDITILDVRSKEEINKSGSIEGALHIHITQLEKKMDKVPKTNPLSIFCGSGMRSMIAASILKRNGWKDIRVTLGGLAAWHSRSHPKITK